MAPKKKVKEDQPVETTAVVNNANRVHHGGVRAAQHGHFVRVVDGVHTGRYGVLEETVDFNEDGTPRDVIIRTRDDDSMLLAVKYEDLVAASAGGR
jgi:hypothetical protein